MSNKEYYNNIYQNELYYIWNRAPGKDVIIETINEYTTTDNLNLLDIGCGVGYLLNRIHKESKHKFNLYGLDSSIVAINKGKINYPYINLYCEDGENTNFKDNMFDVVISYGSLEHFNNPENAIKEISRILKPNKYFFCSIPTLDIDKTNNKEGWYEEKEITNHTIKQFQWNLYRDTWESYFIKNNLELFNIDESKRFGAINPGVFYYGFKR